MPLIQLNLSEDIDNMLKHYMIDNKIEDKREAIVKILRKSIKRSK